MTQQAKSGRIIVLVIVFVTLGISLATMLMATTTNSSRQTVQSVVRLILTGLLLFFVYRGSNVARWIAIVLFALGGLMGLLFGISLMGETTYAVLLLGMGVIYMASAIALAASSSVKQFLQDQKQPA